MGESMTEWPVAGVTGHRPGPAGSLIRRETRWICLHLDRIVVKLRDHHGTRDGHSGLALGADTAFAKAVLHHSLNPWWHIPFPSQADTWGPRDQAHWTTLRIAAGAQLAAESRDRRPRLTPGARETVYGDTYNVGFFHERDRGLVDKVDVLVAVWDTTRRAGGTFGTVKYAADVGRPVILIDPSRKTVGMPSPDRLAWLVGNR